MSNIDKANQEILMRIRSPYTPLVGTHSHHGRQYGGPSAVQEQDYDEAKSLYSMCKSVLLNTGRSPSLDTTETQAFYLELNYPY